MTDLIWLFSYGTLQQGGVQLEVFGRKPTGEPDALPGYRQAMVRITDPAVIAASGSEFHPIVSESGDPADSIPGTAFLVTPDELAAADDYEVSDYRRIPVRLASGRDAWVYVKA